VCKDGEQVSEFGNGLAPNGLLLQNSDGEDNDDTLDDLDPFGVQKDIANVV